MVLFIMGFGFGCLFGGGGWDEKKGVYIRGEKGNDGDWERSFFKEFCGRGEEVRILWFVV